MSIAKLSKEENELTESIAKLTSDKEALEIENQDIFAKMKALDSDLVPRKEAMETSIKEELKKLEEKRAEIAHEIEMADKRLKKQSADENEVIRLKVANENAQEELSSREIEFKARLIAAETAEKNAQEKINLLKTEELRIEQLKTATSDEALKNSDILKRIEESRTDAQKNADILRSESEKFVALQQSANSDRSNLDYLIQQGRGLVAVIRQATHTYCQLNGTAIKIPELTDDMKAIVARSIAPFLFTNDTIVNSKVFDTLVTEEDKQEEILVTE